MAPIKIIAYTINILPVDVSDLLLLDLPLREPPRGHPLPVGAEALDLAVVGPVRDLQPDVQLLGPGRRRGEGEVAAADERAAARADREAGVVNNHHAQLEHLKQGSIVESIHLCKDTDSDTNLY